MQLKAGNTTIHTASVPLEIGTERAVLGRASCQAIALTAIAQSIAAQMGAVGGTIVEAGRDELFLQRVHVPAPFVTLRAIGIIGIESIADGTMIG